MDSTFDYTLNSTGVVYDETCMLEHLSLWDQQHEERPERLQVVLKRCRELGLLDRCRRIPCRQATEDQLLMCHSQSHLSTLAGTSGSDDCCRLEDLSASYDSVFFHPSSYDAAVLAAGSTLSLVEAIIAGTVKNGMAIVRPPGHHASYDEFSGYCLLNNVALAARHAALRRLRVLVVDWDVHHGQGTQRMFYDDDRVMYVSVHRYQHGSFRQLRESEFDHIGTSGGVGYNWNIPLNATGMQDQDLLAVWHRLVLPAASEFAPDLVLVSAGFDAALGCPQGEMRVSPACFAHLTRPLMALASGRVALVLEGGYCLTSLAESAALCLRTLLGDPPPPLPPLQPPCQSMESTVLDVVSAQYRHWQCLALYDTYCHTSGVTSPPASDRLHVAEVTYSGVPAKPGAVFPLVGECPVQTEEEKKRHEEELAQLRNETDLTVAPCRVALYRQVPCSSSQNALDEATLGLKAAIYDVRGEPGADSAPSVLKTIDAVLDGEATSGLCVTSDEVAAPAIRHALRRCQRLLVVDWRDASFHDWPLAVECPASSRAVCVSLSRSSCDVVNLHQDPKEAAAAAAAPASPAPLWTERSYMQTPLEVGSSHFSAWGASEVMAFLSQVILPIAYQLSPQLVLLTMTSPPSSVTSPLVSHVVHHLLAPAGGKAIVIAKDDVSLPCLLGLPPERLPALSLASRGALANLRHIITRERQHWPALPLLKAVPEKIGSTRKVPAIVFSDENQLEEGE